MGKPMALNLAKAGFDLTVYDIKREPVEELVRAGAKAAGSPKEVALVSDIICYSLPDPAISEQLTLDSQNGVLVGAKKGTIIIELSTVLPSTVRKMAEAAKKIGVEVIDSPVMGGHRGAVEGTLYLVVGGEKEVVEKCLPVLQAIGKKISHVGGLGSGALVKLVNNLCAHNSLCAGFEALALAAKAGKDVGIDLKTVFEVIRDGTGTSWVWQNYHSKMLSGQDLGATVDIAYKDSLLMSSMARELGVPLTVHNATLAQLAFYKAEGLGPKDRSSIYRYLEKLLNIQMRI
jgi:3-hydroxyisobutyrate dehydrogenase-like beta-hydroxyacid dehydrogenase